MKIGETKNFLRSARLTLSFFSILISQGVLHAQQASMSGPAQEQMKKGDDAMAAKHFADAASAYKKANKLENESCYMCWLKLALAQFNNSDEHGAASACERALMLAKSDSDRAAAHYLKGEVILGGGEAKRYHDAETEYRAAVDLQKQVADYHFKLAYALFKESQDTQGQEELAAYLKMAPNGKYAADARAIHENPRRAREKFAPEFQVTTLQGQTISLADLQGRVVVLDFWATWCPPCRASVPELRDMTKKYPSDKLVVLSVSADADEEKWREFIGKKNMDWAQYWDKDGSIRKLFGVTAFPTYVVISPDGAISEQIVGMNPQESIVHRLKQKLETMLPKG